LGVSQGYGSGRRQRFRFEPHFEVKIDVFAGSRPITQTEPSKDSASEGILFIFCSVFNWGHFCIVPKNRVFIFAIFWNFKLVFFLARARPQLKTETPALRPKAGVPNSHR